MTSMAPASRSGGLTARELLRAPFTRVWVVLIAATLVSWYIGTDHRIETPVVVTVIVMLVAFTKIRFVGLYFMGLRDAPILLRSIFEGYCLVVFSMILTLYLVA
jgi:hypothetical protein